MAKYLKNTIALCLLGLLVSCNSNSSDKKQVVDGIWESIGYGRIAEIKNEEFVLYDVTDISCLPIFDGSIDIFGDNLSVVNDTLRLKDGINTYFYKRLTEKHPACSSDISEKQKNDLIYNFDVLTATFNDQYAYFDLRNVNRDSLYAATKLKIKPSTTEAEFYVIVEDMLDSFNDGHIGLDATEEVEEAAEAIRENAISKNNNSNEKDYGDFEIANIVADHLLKGEKKTSNNGIINWGNLDNNIGYLQINLMMGLANLNIPDSISGNAYWQTYFGKLEDMTSESHTKLEVEGLNVMMDSILNDFNQNEALILDVRFNGGGKDEIALEIMKRFNAKEHIVFTKKAKHDDGYTKPNTVVLEAAAKPYSKPVYLLTSQQSASATEIMVLSSLQIKNITRVGAHTEGVFSDVLEKALPNGWEVGLSNEVYEDTQGNNYEGKGISPHIKLNYPLDRQTFFRSLANNLDADKAAILNSIKTKN